MLGSSVSRFIGKQAPAKVASAAVAAPNASMESVSREHSHSQASSSERRPPPIVLDGRAVADEWQVRQRENDRLAQCQKRGSDGENGMHVCSFVQR